MCVPRYVHIHPMNAVHMMARGDIRNPGTPVQIWTLEPNEKDIRVIHTEVKTSTGSKTQEL